MEEIKTYKGINLLEKIIEFTTMTPDSNEWNTSALKSNPPRLIRFKQIRSLINAFFEHEDRQNILDNVKSLVGGNANKITIQTLLSGEVLKGKRPEEYSELLTLMKYKVKEREGQINEAEFDRPFVNLIMSYQHLVQYKRHLTDLLTSNSGWLEAGSITSRFSIYLTESITVNLEGKYFELDRALELYINPRGLSFTKEELISKYNFPNENLDEVDFNYI